MFEVTMIKLQMFLTFRGGGGNRIPPRSLKTLSALPMLAIILLLSISEITANRPPRFILDGQTEIVLRLKEGEETPVGSVIYRLRGVDPDGDRLTFGVRPDPYADVVTVHRISDTEAEIYLAKPLDREVRDEYPIVLTLTDGRLGVGNYITQGLLLLVEDVNDCAPVFSAHASSVTLREDSPPGTLVAKLTATDDDEGAYGQVLYKLLDDGNNEPLFTLATIEDSAVVRLARSLDYETATVHELRVVAQDRAKQGRVNSATAHVLVHVRDLDDTPPHFLTTNALARVPEDVPVGTSVLQVRAVDGDRGVNNKIKYTMSRSDGMFNIHPDTGLVQVAKPLDREAMTHAAYVLTITAAEVDPLSKKSNFKNSNKTAITEMTIMVIDVNDEIPRFRNEEGYICEITENAQRNTPVTFIGDARPEIYDYDQGVNGTFQLSIQVDGDQKELRDMFDVTPTQGINEASFLIRVRNPDLLDYERVNQINLTLIAREIGAPERNTSVPVTVFLKDMNDNTPEFTRSSYEVSISEDCIVGTTVAWVQALDDDSGNFGSRGVRYTSLTGTIDDLLFLNPLTGVITIRNCEDEDEIGDWRWDREQVLGAMHQLTVEARDDLGRGNRNTVRLLVHLVDVNDNPPVFSRTKYETRLQENAWQFDQPLRVEAIDSDLNGTKNSEIEYSLDLSEYSGNFTIDPVTGVLSPMSPLDYETLDGELVHGSGNVRTIRLTVRARDLGTPSLSNTVPLYIYVHDMNDHSPRFVRSIYETVVPENATPGTSVIQVLATDLDASAPNNIILYRLEGPGALDKFTIDGETGVVRVAPGGSLDPDLHGRRVYLLRVVAVDGAQGDAQRSATAVLNITVKDVNNKLPVFDKKLSTSPVHILENAPVGSVIKHIRAEDLDSDGRLRYAIDAGSSEARTERGTAVNLQDSSLPFRLDPDTGVLTLYRPLDRETVDTYRLALTVEDLNAVEPRTQQDTTYLTILVDDVNDNNPKFRRPFYLMSVGENSKPGSTIGTVTADDADKNRTVQYILEGLPEIKDMLHVDSSSGEIKVIGDIDHEVNSWINFTVVATDNGIPTRSSRVEVYVQVLDENDNNPIFDREPKELSISEDTPPGQKIAVLRATDLDSGDYGKVTYLIDRLSSQGMFNLDAETGSLTLASQLDREVRSSYLLVVEAWDNYHTGHQLGHSRNAFKQINVTVLDVNDNEPVLHIPEGCITITEYHEELGLVAQVHVNDLDDPNTPNGQVIIDIVEGNELGLFKIRQRDEFSGEVMTRKSLRGKHGNYTLTLRAEDLGSPPLSTQRELHVCVMDYNDHAPVFISPPHNTTLRVPENATVGSALVQIIATDEDVGQNGAVRYKLRNDPAGHWRTFNLQPVSGILELRQPLDRNKQKIYDIRIEAYDLGSPKPLRSDFDLTIYVTNVNDYQPQFLVDEVYLNFTENALEGEEIRKLPNTVDRDELELEGPPAPVCYYIVAGNENGLFKLNALTHELGVGQALDREVQGEHIILVKATEDCVNPPANQSFFDPLDDTLLKVVINVVDINDNPPKFVQRVFTGGVSTAASFGAEFMRVKAEDLDENENAVITYRLIGDIQMTLAEGLDGLVRAPAFLVDPETGAILLNFDPQHGMKGYFDFAVEASDSGGLKDIARVFIYLLREDQRVRFVLRQHVPELRDRIDTFRRVLENVTGAIVNVDEFRVHVNRDGTVDKTRTDLYMHLVDRTDNSILEVEDVLRLVDENTELLDDLFKEFNVLDTQPGGSNDGSGLSRDGRALSISEASAGVTLWLTAGCLFLATLLLLCLALCLSQRHAYQRKLKAATTTAYGGSDLDGRGLSGLSGRVPNTNKHSVEGSNPIWLRAYENEWYKHTDDFSYYSQGESGGQEDSLDENEVSGTDSVTGSPDRLHQSSPLHHPHHPHHRHHHHHHRLDTSNSKTAHSVLSEDEEDLSSSPMDAQANCAQVVYQSVQGSSKPPAPRPPRNLETTEL